MTYKQYKIWIACTFLCGMVAFVSLFLGSANAQIVTSNAVTKRLSAPSTGMDREYNEFKISPNSQYVVFTASEIGASTREELFSVPIDGSEPPLKLNGPITPSVQIRYFDISPTSAYVVYVTQNAGLDQLYSVPTAGGDPVRLNVDPDPMGGTTVTRGVEFTPDGSGVVFGSDHENDPRTEYYHVLLEGGPLTKLDKPDLIGSIFPSRITPDGDYMLFDSYSVDKGINSTGLFSVPMDGSDYITLDLPLTEDQDLTLFVPVYLSRSSSRAVVSVTNGDDTRELYSISMVDGSFIELSGPNSTGLRVIDSAIANDESSIILLAQEEAEDIGIYTIPFAGGSPVSVTNPAQLPANIELIDVTADAGFVVFTAYEGDENKKDLYSLSISNGIVTKLNPTRSTDAWFGVLDAQITPDGQTVVFKFQPEGESHYTVLSVPIAGGTPIDVARQILDSEPVSGFYWSIKEVVIAPDSQSLFVEAWDNTLVGLNSSYSLANWFKVPIVGGPPLQLNHPLQHAAYENISDAEISPDGNYLVFQGHTPEIVYYAERDLYVSYLSTENEPPEMGYIRRQNSRSGQTLEIDMRAFDPNVGDEISITVLSQPDFLTATISENRVVFEGRPNKSHVGEHFIEVELRDQNDLVYLETYPFNIVESNGRPRFVVDDDSFDGYYMQSVVGSFFEVTFEATDPDIEDDLAFSANLPAWLTLTNNGDRTVTLSGTPPEAAADSRLLPDLRVIDPAGRDAQLALFIDVLPQVTYVERQVSPFNTTVEGSGFGLSPNGDVAFYHARSSSSINEVFYGASLPISLSFPLGNPIESLGRANGQKVDYRFTTDGKFILYRVPSDQYYTLKSEAISVNGVGNTDQLNAGSTRGVYSDLVDEPYQTTPNGERVVYLSDIDTENQFELYTVPIREENGTVYDGSLIKLNETLPEGASISGFAVTNDDVIYAADAEVLGRYELYQVPLTGGVVQKISLAYAPDAVGLGVELIGLSPNGELAIYRMNTAGPDADVWDLMAVSLVDGATTTLLETNATFADTHSSLTFSQDGNTVFFIYEDIDRSPVNQLYAVATDGSFPTLLKSPTLPDGILVNYELTPDGSAIIYQLDMDQTDRHALFMVPVAGGPSQRITQDLDATIHQFEISPDGSSVLYLQTAQDDAQAVSDLYWASLDGSTFPEKINPELVAGGGVRDAKFRPDGVTIVYSADQTIVGEVELFEVNLTDRSARKLSTPIENGGQGVIQFELTPDSEQVVYQADQNGDSFFSLYSTLFNAQPVIESEPIRTAYVGDEYRYEIEVVDPDLESDVVITARAFTHYEGGDRWYTLTDNGDGTALLAGTPSEEHVGIINVEIKVTDNLGSVNSQTFPLQVIDPPNRPPRIVSEPVTNATEGVEYFYLFEANDPDSGDVLTTTVADLPDWLTFVDLGEGTAELVGMPDDADVGTHLVTLEVSDQDGELSIQSFALTVDSVADPPVFDIPPVDPVVETNGVFEQIITASDPDSGSDLAIVALELPAWLNLIDRGDGTALLRGIPTAVENGVYAVRLQVIDETGRSAELTFTITVNLPVVGSGPSEPVTDMEYEIYLSLFRFD